MTNGFQLVIQKIMFNLRNIFKISRCIVNSTKTKPNQSNFISFKYANNRLKIPSIGYKTNFVTKTFLALNILKWIGFEEEDEEKESELIMTLKRAVLCMNREQYDKAEQMLHLALRLAQQQQTSQGILYCYDLMANLAMERLELQKAEKLFVSVMQLLLSHGEKEDDLKMIHISLKLARIKHLLSDEESAELGYKWCLEKIAKQSNKNEDYKVLYGVIKDWYSQYLLDVGRTEESLKHLHEAYNVCIEVKGYNDEQTLLLLNDLGITSWRAGDMDNAQKFLTQAVNIGKNIDEKSHLGVVKANLGLIYLEKGLKQEAQKECKEAWHLGRKHDSNVSMEQANYCFEQLKVFMEK